ncbi:hypothetical protein Ccrd_000994 [Cynara cardunculus var. scolymus]|uniref:Uncharacterized protein n=1 Tax=Cynara cardunculus var. scolymus TaxID=59895 RepID=A0A124SDG9_CYNCS|nr:hypothetical protein Ccrd_000994 [Cynara cardunculus var. scolymus]
MWSALAFWIVQSLAGFCDRGGTRPASVDIVMSR